jgi:hypothetical protein
METIQVQFYAGVISSLIFSISNIFMIRKAYKTNDLKSYSPGHLALSNLGNLIHWIYISSLPFGPIWFLHAYYTIVTALMLYWYFRYKDNGVVASIIRLSAFAAVSMRYGINSLIVRQPIVNI